MDIMRYIENLREKPEHVRKRVSLSISLGLSTLIFAGWIASYGVKTSSVLTEKDTNGNTVYTVESPTRSLTASVSGLFSDIKNIFSGSNKYEYSVEDEVELRAGNR